MVQTDVGEVTRRLQAWSYGDKHALNELVPLVYRELRGLAAAYLRRERPTHTLQPTALVHEAYLRLAHQPSLDCQSRTQFFAVAAHLMRQILVDHARRHRAVKRYGGNKITLDEGVVAVDAQVVELIALDQALEKLAGLDTRQARIVEMRFFGGLKEDEIAEVLGLSVITVKRDWRLARAVLFSNLGSRGILNERAP
jgi:RNA polymerase sigma factor (TIGR02999 family)